MGSIFSYDSKLMIILGKLADLIVLNLLWLLCCIPIVTIGSSTAAMYYTSLKIVRGDDEHIVKMFFHSFRQNLRQGIYLTLFFIVMTALLVFDFRVCTAWTESVIGEILIGLFMVITFLLILTLLYAFPVLAQFENSTAGILKVSLFMSIRHIFYTIAILIIDMIPVIMILFFTYYFLRSLPLWIFLGGSVTARINSHMFDRIFRRYMPPQENDAVS